MPTSLPPHDHFAPTRWTVVLTAGRDSYTQAHAALEQLCRAYWYPLYAYVRRRGYAPHDAQDLTQEFFARLLGKKKLAGLTRDGGKFRSFLLTALNHFLVDEWKRASARKHGCAQVISLDAVSADHRADIFSLGVVFYEMLTGELPDKKLEPPSKKVVIDVRLDDLKSRRAQKVLRPQASCADIVDMGCIPRFSVGIPHACRGDRWAPQLPQLSQRH